VFLLCALPLFAAEESEILIFPEPGCDVGNLRWGMTVEEVQARLGGKFAEYKTDGTVHAIFIHGTYSNRKADMIYIFSEKGLSLVFADINDKSSEFNDIFTKEANSKTEKLIALDEAYTALLDLQRIFESFRGKLGLETKEDFEKKGSVSLWFFKRTYIAAEASTLFIWKR